MPSPSEPLAAQTWDESFKDLVALAAHWVVVECVTSRTPWNSLTPISSVILRACELVAAMANHRGILPGYVTVTPTQMMAAVQDLAGSLKVPTMPLPMAVPYQPPPAVVPGTAPADPFVVPGTVTPSPMLHTSTIEPTPTIVSTGTVEPHNA
jgi:hypothetical protein